MSNYLSPLYSFLFVYFVDGYPKSVNRELHAIYLCILTRTEGADIQN